MAGKKPKSKPEKVPEVQYGPNNPHPLSQMKTELVWEGKSDRYGSSDSCDNVFHAPLLAPHLRRLAFALHVI